MTPTYAVQHPAVYVAKVVADHDFGKVVNSNAWSTRENAFQWGNDAAVEAYNAAQAEDPTFDDYSFRVVIEEWILQDQ